MQIVVVWSKFQWMLFPGLQLTNFPLVPHIYASVNQVSIGSDNGLLPIRRQAIIWTSVGLLSTGRLGTSFSEILIKIQNFSFTKMHLKISCARRWPFYPMEDELTINEHLVWILRVKKCCLKGVDNGAHSMMTTSNGNIFRVTGPLWGESTGHRRIPLTKVSNTELWCLLWSAWTNDWANNRDAGDLKSYRTHYDGTVM